MGEQRVLQLLSCHRFGLRLAWKTARTTMRSLSSTKKTSYLISDPFAHHSPRRPFARIPMIRVQPAVKFSLLFVGKGNGIRDLRNAVPNILHELYPFGDTQVHYVCFSQCAHDDATIPLSWIEFNLFPGNSRSRQGTGRTSASPVFFVSSVPP